MKQLKPGMRLRLAAPESISAPTKANGRMGIGGFTMSSVILTHLSRRYSVLYAIHAEIPARFALVIVEMMPMATPRSLTAALSAATEINHDRQIQPTA